ncbi:MAG: TIGR00730 family Rossman fold protein [Beijerinckiaceae bacterium]
MPHSIQSVCVYCGSGTGSDPAFTQAADRFGRILGEAGVRLVYGGGGTGMMGAVARGVLAVGGTVTGIIPTFLKARELELKEASEMIVVPDMHTRKKMMFDLSDAFVALPGGIGTLEELAEQMTWAQIGQHRKPIVIANIQGFWNPLLALFAHMRETQFIRAAAEVPPLVAETETEILPMLRAHAGAMRVEGNAAILTRM